MDWHVHVFRLCQIGALGDERHMLLADLGQEVSPLVTDCSDVMAGPVWAKNQCGYGHSTMPGPGQDKGSKGTAKVACCWI